MQKPILICDDDEGILDMTALILETFNYKTVKESNSVHIFDAIEAERPLLILLDVWMPVITGDEIVKKLKSDDSTKHIPVILMSANRDLKEVAKECGADAYLEKPFDIDDLNSIVSACAQGK